MWRRSKTKSAKRLASLGLLQDAMGRVEQDRAEAEAQAPAEAQAQAEAQAEAQVKAQAEDQQLLKHQVPSQQGTPREQQGTPRQRSAAGGAGR